jgi:tricorn protease-like protein
MHPRNPLTLLSLLAALVPAASASAQTTARVSVDSAGAQGNNNSFSASCSGTGRFIAFQSTASNLVPGDTNSHYDVFVRDRQNALTVRVSVSSAGVQGNNQSLSPAISEDGRYVAYQSYAANLVTGDTNNTSDIFVYDRQTAQTTRVSVDSFGVQGNSVSRTPSISASGQFVAFSSNANNLVAGDTNGTYDVFLHDRQTGVTTLLSVDPLGAIGNAESAEPAISADGNFVAFHSTATNLVPGDTNVSSDVFVRDLLTAQTVRVSVDSSGVEGNRLSRNASISADGSVVTFESNAFNLVLLDTNNTSDVFVHDRMTAQTTRISLDDLGQQVNGLSRNAVISNDGLLIAFTSLATDLVHGDTNGVEDVFVHDRGAAHVDRVSVSTLGAQGNAKSLLPSISGDGLIVAFSADASNLVPGDSNAKDDVFAHDRVRLSPTLTKSGTCPGPMVLTVAGASPGGPVAYLYGPSGIYTNPSMPCAGVVLNINPPNLGALDTADGAGGSVVNLSAPLAACGLTVQVVDLTTCVPTNSLIL